MALISILSSSDHGSDTDIADAPSAYRSDDDDSSGLPIHGHGSSETSQDDELGNRDYHQPTQTSLLSFLYYYASLFPFLNELMVTMVGRLESDWKDLERVGVEMVALSEHL